MAKPPLSLVHSAPDEVRGFAPVDDIPAMARSMLAASGLDMGDAKTLGWTFHSAVETKTLLSTAWPLPSMRIPYFTTEGARVPLRARPGWPDFVRYRALRTPVPAPADFNKYTQESRTGVCAYFPPNADWPSIINDWTKPILITEGEKKAAKGCKEGFNVIGLGGVNSYGAKSNLGARLLPELDAILWVRREVTIVYDSDLRSNTHVSDAMNDLAEVLTDVGAIVRTVLLPTLNGDEKVGLDDFLLLAGAAALDDLLAQTAIHLNFGKAMWEINKTHAFVAPLSRVLNMRSTTLSTTAAFKDEVAGKHTTQELNKDGGLKFIEVPAGPAWIGWRMRQQVQQIVYDPSKAPLALVPSSVDYSGEHERDFNCWPGWGVQAKKGPVKLFTALLDHLFTGAEPELKTWFIQWLAYPLQHPGIKMYTACLIWSRVEGVGKSLLGTCMRRIYGKNFSLVEQAEIDSSFNSWAERRQFILADDITGSDKRHLFDRLKKMITQESVRINQKNQPHYEIDDCMNWMFTSNQPDAFIMGDTDRRFAIHEVTVKPLSTEFYAEFNTWFRSEEGAAAIFHYFLHVDLTGFNPHARAPVSAAKNRMAQAARSDLATWVLDVVASPDEFLRVGDAPLAGDLFTNSQILSCYAARIGVQTESIPPKRMGGELTRAGVRQVHGGQVVTGKGIKADRYYAVRNVEKWVKASLAEIQVHLGKGAPGAVVKKSKKY